MRVYFTLGKYIIIIGSSINVCIVLYLLVVLDFGSMAGGLTWLLTTVYRLIMES